MKLFNQKISTSSFCEHLLSLETVYSNSQIVSITHWKEKNTLLLHEFVTFRALVHGDDTYLRIERYSERRGPLHHPRNWHFVFPAKDTVGNSELLPRAIYLTLSLLGNHDEERGGGHARGHRLGSSGACLI